MLIKSRGNINYFNSKIGRTINYFNSKIGRTINYLPFATPIRATINKYYFKVRVSLDHLNPKIGINFHNLYLAIQGYTLALTVLTDRFIIGKGKADENNRCNNYCSHKIFYENI